MICYYIKRRLKKRKQCFINNKKIEKKVLTLNLQFDTINKQLRK